MTIVQKKLYQGFHSQGWYVVGRGGSWAAALRPLNAYIEAKAKKAVEAEREACAKVCEDASQPSEGEMHSDAQWAGLCLAAAIRARSKT